MRARVHDHPESPTPSILREQLGLKHKRNDGYDRHKCNQDQRHPQECWQLFSGAKPIPLIINNATDRLQLTSFLAAGDQQAATMERGPGTRLKIPQDWHFTCRKTPKNCSILTILVCGTRRVTDGQQHTVHTTSCLLLGVFHVSVACFLLNNFCNHVVLHAVIAGHLTCAHARVA